MPTEKCYKKPNRTTIRRFRCSDLRRIYEYVAMNDPDGAQCVVNELSTVGKEARELAFNILAGIAILERFLEETKEVRTAWFLVVRFLRFIPFLRALVAPMEAMLVTLLLIEESNIVPELKEYFTRLADEQQPCGVECR
jgi:hypothetical protein